MHGFLVETLNERIVLGCQDTRFVRRYWSLASFTPLYCLFLLFTQLKDYSLELKDLMVEGVHLVFVFEEVVFVHVLYLKFVVLCATCLDAIVVIEHLECLFARLKATRAYGRNIIVAKDVVRAGQHVRELELACI